MSPAELAACRRQPYSSRVRAACGAAGSLEGTPFSAAAHCPQANHRDVRPEECAKHVPAPRSVFQRASFNLRWTEFLERNDCRLLVLETGAHFWKEAAAMAAPYAESYATMAAGVVAYLEDHFLRLPGRRVAYVTTPAGAPDCDTYSAPQQPRPVDLCPP